MTTNIADRIQQLVDEAYATGHLAGYGLGQDAGYALAYAEVEVDPAEEIFYPADPEPVNLDDEGYDEDGYDLFGFNRAGYDPEGYDSEGFDIDGYDKNGWDVDGINEDGDCNDPDCVYCNPQPQDDEQGPDAVAEEDELPEDGLTDEGLCSWEGCPICYPEPMLDPNIFTYGVQSGSEDPDYDYLPDAEEIPVPEYSNGPDYQEKLAIAYEAGYNPEDYAELDPMFLVALQDDIETLQENGQNAADFLVTLVGQLDDWCSGVDVRLTETVEKFETIEGFFQAFAPWSEEVQEELGQLQEDVLDLSETVEADAVFLDALDDRLSKIEGLGLEKLVLDLQRLAN